MEEIKHTKWEQVKAARGLVTHRIDKYGAWMHITHPSKIKCEFCDQKTDGRESKG